MGSCPIIKRKSEGKCSSKNVILFYVFFFRKLQLFHEYGILLFLGYSFSEKNKIKIGAKEINSWSIDAVRLR